MTGARTRRRIAAAILAAALLPAPATSGPAAPPPTLTAALAGNTLSGVLFLPRETAKGEILDRVVFQAYLQADGRALMRRWQPAQDAYTVVGERRWRVAGDTLCLDFPPDEDVPSLCIEVHVWGPRIAGNTTGPGRFAMLDANIEPGDTILAAR